MVRTFALLVCLLPLSVSAEEYICNISIWQQPEEPYLLSVNRRGEQFVLESTNLLGGNGTFFSEQIQEDKLKITLTRLGIGGFAEVILINKESLRISLIGIQTEYTPDYWVAQRGTCMVRE